MQRRRHPVQPLFEEGRDHLDVLRVLQLVLRDVLDEEALRQPEHARNAPSPQSCADALQHVVEETAQLGRLRELPARRLRDRGGIEEPPILLTLSRKEPARLHRCDVAQMPADGAVSWTRLPHPAPFRNGIDGLLEEAARGFQLGDQRIAGSGARSHRKASRRRSCPARAMARWSAGISFQRPPSSGSEARQTPCWNGAQ